ncbi:Os10g0469100, partial [Oryza sativa Japonica Group]
SSPPRSQALAAPCRGGARAPSTSPAISFTESLIKPPPTAKETASAPLYLRPRAAQHFASSTAVAIRKPGETLTSPPPPIRENSPHLRPGLRPKLR